MNEPKITAVARYITASGSTYLFHVAEHRLERINDKPLRLASGEVTERTTWTVDNFGFAAHPGLIGAFTMMFIVQEESEPIITTAVARMEFV